MRINKIKIKNFRQYKDITFNFKKTSDHDLVSIIGQNGIGKTNLLNAITWCLYEDELHLGIKKNALDIPNLSALEAAKQNLEVSVELEVEDEDSIKTTFLRTATFLKNNDNNSSFKMTSPLKIFRTLNPYGPPTNIDKQELIDLLIKKIFPKSISNYFFFDGEQLDHYFKDTEVNSIKDNILQISNIHILKEIERKLGETLKDKRNEVGKKSTNTSTLVEELEKLEQNKDYWEDQISTLSSNIETAKVKLEEISIQLKGIEDVKALENRRESLIKELQKIYSEKGKLKEILFNFVREYTVLISFFPKVKLLLDTINDKEMKGYLPPSIDKKLLKEIVISHKCSICGSEVSEKNLEKIDSLLKELEYSTNISHLLVSLRPSLENVIDQLKKYPTEKVIKLEALKNLENKITTFEKEKNDIDLKLSTYTDKDIIIRLQTEREDLESARETNLKKQGHAESQLQDLRKKYENKNKEYLDACSKEASLRKLSSQIKFLEEAINTVKNCKDELIEEIREQIRAETEKNFFNLLWKNSTFKKVELDENFKVKLFNIYNIQCLGSCSAAERALLALSFTLALHKISGFETPLVIDTPISRISDENRKNFAEILKKISLEKQLIFLFTPSEYSDEIREVFDSTNMTKFILKTENETETII